MENQEAPTELETEGVIEAPKASGRLRQAALESFVSAGGPDFAILKQVPMTVQVEIGRTVMTLGEVLDELEVGSSIRLDRHAGDPVEVYVNGALFARAEVVLVQDQIGARIIELISPDKANRPAGLR
jgi:flagellar motor switch protein FliN